MKFSDVSVISVRILNDKYEKKYYKFGKTTVKKKIQLGNSNKTLHLPGFWLKVPNKQMGGFVSSSKCVLLAYKQITSGLLYYS